MEDLRERNESIAIIFFNTFICRLVTFPIFNYDSQRSHKIQSSVLTRTKEEYTRSELEFY